MIYAGTRNGKDYGFYLESDNLQNYVEITEEEHRKLLDGQSEGKQIKFYKDKKPTLEEPPKEVKAEDESCKLKKLLTETDYIVIKIAEGEATKEEYADVLKQRKEARARINELEVIVKQAKLN